MKISRRNFLGKAVKSLALVVIAPMVAIPKPSPSQPGRPPGSHVKDKNKAIQVHSKFECVDFKPYIEVKEYKAGQTVTFQDLRTDECSMCAKRGKCRQGGKYFQDGMEYWSRKLQARLYNEAILTKFI
jgi:membrane-bound inhibitor of C-type lysozyme